MEKALIENTKAMFGVALGDSHRHALIVGERRGLEMALRFFTQEFIAADDKDDI